MSNSTCVLSCNDSGLSIAGNVIGILTFAGGILVALAVNARLAANSSHDLIILVDEFEDAKRQIRRHLDRLHSHVPSDPLRRAELEDITALLYRGFGVLEAISYELKDIPIDKHGKWEVVKTSLQGLQKQEQLAALVEKAQYVSREAQIRMMQFEQDQMREVLVEVNDDQRRRSNALYEMLQGKERAIVLPDLEEQEEQAPKFEDIMSTMARPNYPATNDGHHGAMPHSSEDRQATVLRSQIQVGISRQQINSEGGRESDPLGNLLRARTMILDATRSEGDAVEPETGSSM